MRKPSYVLEMNNKGRYRRNFRNRVRVLLGGVEFADDFFSLHPELIDAGERSMLYHFYKGGASWKGAEIFFRRTIRPTLLRDRKAAR